MKFYKVVFIKKIISLLITFIFLIFAILNINDPDGLIWIITYLTIACLPWINIINQKKLNIFAILIFIIGSFISLGLLNSIMPQQYDDQMISLWEYQREGIGLILGALWVALGKKLLN
tara:strand:- start:64 stop:417 length:354 start_codon:yes stop_codon:yes gene_type:complete